MATQADTEAKPKPKPKPLTSATSISEESSSLLSSYLGVGFALFLGFLPKNSLSYVASLQSRNRILALKLFQAEEQLRQLRSRRKEDAKANARVVEIFAGHRNGWREEERRLFGEIEAAAEEIAGLRARLAEAEAATAEMRTCVERLEREVAERDEMIELLARSRDGEGEDEDLGEKEKVNGGTCGDFRGTGAKVRVSERADPAPEACFLERNGELELDEIAALYAQQSGFGTELFPPQVHAAAPVVASKPWIERSNGWQDTQYDSLESTYNIKHLVPRRESPWKVDGESSGVPAKLKLLEQELINLEKVGKGDLSKIPTLMRKQAKRYQSLAGKIDDLCRRMQVTDPCDPTLSPEFRTQRQTEFLLEAFQLQNRATETRDKLNALQTETAKCSFGDELTAQAKLNTRRSLDSIRSNFKEIQRNLEIWLARIMGDLEGILARDGASRVRDFYLSPYPFVR
ncbi:hypothetical protein ACMD2_10556 [Ananas comosus]|uniref:Uncharacterized protein n=1 Tax=Ananas comosus TaxID=4615 RepID=A0A199V748_ANACO|nr:hypothetical protein ACMD2_10556 [Ananas comosus]